MKKFNQDRRGGGFSRAGGFKRGRPSADREDKQMYSAVCSECESSCRVPFRPSDDKPVFCNNCFNKRGGGRELGRSAGFAGSPAAHQIGGFSANDLKTQLAMLNIKLDKILKLLATEEEKQD